MRNRGSVRSLTESHRAAVKRPDHRKFLPQPRRTVAAPGPPARPAGSCHPFPANLAANRLGRLRHFNPANLIPPGATDAAKPGSPTSAGQDDPANLKILIPAQRTAPVNSHSTTSPSGSGHFRVKSLTSSGQCRIFKIKITTSPSRSRIFKIKNVRLAG